MVKTGLEILIEKRMELIRGKRIGLVVNPTSVNRKLVHAINILKERTDINLTTLFGPQHGIRGETQDNMIEWEGFVDPFTKLPVYSLYGQHRKPTGKMFANLDAVLFDIQDIGAKYYTFIYTMSYVMQACKEFNKKFIVLDRPNPITGTIIEGPVTRDGFTSFVGLHPIIIRHGMTVAELALLFQNEFSIKCDMEIVKMEGWKRSMWYDETMLPWIIPSPNMPTLESALVYPGMCLLEGTNLSEGRGTTKPFELFGAPFIDPYQLYNKMTEYELPGLIFRPVYFQPTFQKWFGQLCGGLQIHIIDRNAYKSVITAVSIIKAIRDLYPREFKWKEPPYEYEYKKLPFDILAGSDSVREMIESGYSLPEIEESWNNDTNLFIKIRTKYLLY